MEEYRKRSVPPQHYDEERAVYIRENFGDIHTNTPSTAPRFVECSKLHGGSCVARQLVYPGEHIKKALQIQILVNFLPGLVMLNTKLLNWEVLIKWLKTTTFSTCCTTSFILLYGLIFSITMCAVRNIRQSDSTWNPFLCGNLSALALIVEQDERRKEILVVAFTQAMNIMYYLLKKRNLMFPIPKNGDVLLFLHFIEHSYVD